MLLKDYITKLEAIKKEYGGDILVVYSADDEGNKFDLVQFDPTTGQFKDDEFRPTKTNKVNCVCIN